MTAKNRGDHATKNGKAPIHLTPRGFPTARRHDRKVILEKKRIYDPLRNKYTEKDPRCPRQGNTLSLTSLLFAIPHSVRRNRRTRIAYVVATSCVPGRS